MKIIPVITIIFLLSTFAFGDGFEPESIATFSSVPRIHSSANEIINIQELFTKENQTGINIDKESPFWEKLYQKNTTF